LERKPAATLEFNSDLFVAAEGEARKLSSTKDGTLVTDILLPVIRKALAGTGNIAHLEDEAPVAKKGGLGGILGKLKAKG